MWGWIALLAAGGGALLWARSARASGDDGAVDGEVFQSGVASFYGPGLEGNLTANGEAFDASGMTAAHRTLPFNTRLRVTDVDTGKSVDVRVNDRGPFVSGRILDLAQGAAEALGITERGTANVELRLL